MAVIRETVIQERAGEARLDNELVAGTEKAAAIIQQHNQTISEQARRIQELESQDAETVGVVSEGSAARAERMALKRRALESLKRAGVVVAILAVFALGITAGNKLGYLSGGEQQARVEPGTSGFQYSLT